MLIIIGGAKAVHNAPSTASPHQGHPFSSVPAKERDIASCFLPASSVRPSSGTPVLTPVHSAPLLSLPQSINSTPGSIMYSQSQSAVRPLLYQGQVVPGTLPSSGPSTAISMSTYPTQQANVYQVHQGSLNTRNYGIPLGVQPGPVQHVYNAATGPQRLFSGPPPPLHIPPHGQPAPLFGQPLLQSTPPFGHPTPQRAPPFGHPAPPLGQRRPRQ